MWYEDWKTLLGQTADRAVAHLESLPEADIAPRVGYDEVADRLGGPLPEDPSAPEEVVAALADGVAGGLMGMPAPRFFGWVIGGGLPAAVAADWLTTVWDQNAALASATPAAMAAEQVACDWMLDLFGLPASSSVGLVTGCQMAHVTCLAAARDHVLREAGWDAAVDGLVGAPRVRLIGGAEWHDTVPRALRLLGLGERTAQLVDVDEQGRMRPDALAAALAEGDGPVIVVTQVGNLHTGACDPVGELADVLAAHRAECGVPGWLHVDGAFGLWAAASPVRRSLVAGVDRADSWATDAHKWLNVPYDCGIAICRDAQAHRRAMGVHAAYLPPESGDAARDAVGLNPEFSRRARGFTVYAALRQLGRRGTAELVDRLCDAASQLADGLRGLGLEVVNEVVLNQVVVRAADDARTLALAQAIQADGTCFAHHSTYRGRTVIRFSVSNWGTDAAEVERTLAAVERCR